MPSAANYVFNIAELVAMIIAHSVGPDWADLDSPDKYNLDSIQLVNRTTYTEARRVQWASVFMVQKKPCEAFKTPEDFLNFIAQPSSPVMAFSIANRLRQTEKLTISPKLKYWTALQQYQFPKLNTVSVQLSDYSDPRFGVHLTGARITTFIISAENRWNLGPASEDHLKKLVEDMKKCGPNLRAVHLLKKKEIWFNSWCNNWGSNRCADYGCAILDAFPDLKHFEGRTSRTSDLSQSLAMAICKHQKLESLELHIDEMEPMVFAPNFIEEQFKAHDLFSQVRTLDIQFTPLCELNCLALFPQLEECKIYIKIYAKEIEEAPDELPSCLTYFNEHPHLKALTITCEVEDAMEGAYQPITQNDLDYLADKLPLLEKLDVTIHHTESDPDDYDTDGEFFDDSKTLDDPTIPVHFDFVYHRPKLEDGFLDDFVEKHPHLTEIFLNCFIDTWHMSEDGLKELCDENPRLKYVCINAYKPFDDDKTGRSEICLNDWSLSNRSWFAGQGGEM